MHSLAEGKAGVRTAGNVGEGGVCVPAEGLIMLSVITMFPSKGREQIKINEHTA